MYFLTEEVSGNLSHLGQQAEGKRRAKSRYNKLPLFWRSFAYFVYRYILRGGFVDGKEGFIFAFIQGWWYRTLVDVKVLEVMKWMKANHLDANSPEDRQALKQYIKDHWGIVLSSRGSV